MGRGIVATGRRASQALPTHPNNCLPMQRFPSEVVRCPRACVRRPDYIGSYSNCNLRLRGKGIERVGQA